MFTNKTLFLALLLLILMFPLFSQTTPKPGPGTKPGIGIGDLFPPPTNRTFMLGDQSLSLNLGGFFPLFNQDLSGNVLNPNLSAGASASLRFLAHLDNNFLLGLDLSGCLSATPNDTLYMVPITAQGSYTIRTPIVDIPLYLGAGVLISRYLQLNHFDLIIKPGLGVYYNFDRNWSFGVNADYWWVPQLMQDATQSRFGNFLDVQLSMMYHLGK